MLLLAIDTKDRFEVLFRIADTEFIIDADTAYFMLTNDEYDLLHQVLPSHEVVSDSNA
jgi:hypothetical protein